MVKVALASALLCAALSSASAQRPVDLLKERIAARVEALAENPRTRVICPEQQGLRLAGCLLRDATAQAMLHTAIKRVENIEEVRRLRLERSRAGGRRNDGLCRRRAARGADQSAPLPPGPMPAQHTLGHPNRRRAHLRPAAFPSALARHACSSPRSCP